jgi:hypothetical protein
MSVRQLWELRICPELDATLNQLFAGEGGSSCRRHRPLCPNTTVLLLAV